MGLETPVEIKNLHLAINKKQAKYLGYPLEKRMDRTKLLPTLSQGGGIGAASFFLNVSLLSAPGLGYRRFFTSRHFGMDPHFWSVLIIGTTHNIFWACFHHAFVGLYGLKETGLFFMVFFPLPPRSPSKHLAFFLAGILFTKEKNL